METIKKNIQGIVRLSRYQEHLGDTVIASSFAVLASQRFVDYRTVMVLLANILSITYAFMINDVEDEKEDCLDKKKRARNPVSSGLLMKRNAIIVTILSASGAILFYAFGGKNAVLYGGGGLLCGTLYSLKRIRLKKYPVTDIASHGLFHAVFPFIAMYSLGGGGLSLKSSIPLVSFLLLSIASDLRNELRDERIDKASGFKNTVSLIGKDVVKPITEGIKILCLLLLIGFFFVNLSFEALLVSFLYGIVLIPLIFFISQTKKMLLGRNLEGFNFLNGIVILLCIYIFPQLFLFT